MKEKRLRLQFSLTQVRLYLLMNVRIIYLKLVVGSNSFEGEMHDKKENDLQVASISYYIILTIIEIILENPRRLFYSAEFDFVRTLVPKIL